MRISDWSSDVCSSDLQTSARLICGFTGDGRRVVPLSVPAGVSSTDGPPPKSQGKYMTVNVKNWQELKKPNSLEIKAGGDPKRKATFVRSEEHTSELQSLMRISYAVFCLKKKTNHNNT